MRAGVWCAATALALLTLASALRTPQVEGAARVGRRLPAPSDPDERLEAEDAPPRPHISRRREEILDRNRSLDRSRTRSRPIADSVTESPQPQRNERFDSRRTYSRTRSRPNESEASRETPTIRDNGTKSRTRPNSRRTFQTPSEASSPKPEVTRPQISRSNLDDSTKITTIRPSTFEAHDTSTQFRRRAPTSPTPESAVTRRRGRVNTRVDTRALDLAVSGTTNTIIAYNKEPTQAGTAEDLRNSRKLRYKTRLSETDTNLTGEGITATNEVTKSSQIKESITSQPEIQPTTTVLETTTQPSTEAPAAKPDLIKENKVLRRPLTRGKVNFRPAVGLTKKVKTSDEISEDDNYPESFKALLQAKNASTQANSPANESLSVKASQRVYKTYTPSSQSTNTGPAKNKYSRFRAKQTKANEEVKSEEPKKEGDQEQRPTDAVTATEKPKSRVTEFRPRPAYSLRNRKSSFNTSTTSESSSNQSTERSSYKSNRKLKTSTTEPPKVESTSKFKRLGTNTLLKKSLPRPSYYSRRNATKPASSETSVVVENINVENKDANVKSVLPKTSYYSRLRNKQNDAVPVSSTEASTGVSVETPAEKKMEDTADMPLIFSLLKKNPDKTLKSESQITNEPEREKKMFIIAVSSKESSENSTENEVVTKGEESPINIVSSTIKYHSNIKDNAALNVSESKDQVAHEATPPVRNVQTRKYGRKRPKPEYYEEAIESTPKPRDRSLRKFSDSYSKTTEPTTNGIPVESEKQKSRFSSKFRGSYNDKPIYKATVPTVTPSTAWLKFFVTDPQLAKSVEEPYWFEGEDIYITTEMSRLNFTAPSISHESSLELVNGII